MTIQESTQRLQEAVEKKVSEYAEREVEACVGSRQSIDSVDVAVLHCDDHLDCMEVQNALSQLAKSICMERWDDMVAKHIEVWEEER